MRFSTSLLSLIVAGSSAFAKADTVAEIAAADPTQFSTLVAAADAAGLLEALSDPDAPPITLFAPIDEAFEAVNVTKLLQDEWSAHLTSLLTYHILPEEVPSTELSLGLTVPTLEGSLINVTSLDPVQINSAEVIAADIEASNGIVHIVDEVTFCLLFHFYRNNFSLPEL
jgi:uncharacterized surface protein with fasciclin (FAS1) repeats